MLNCDFTTQGNVTLQLGLTAQCVAYRVRPYCYRQPVVAIVDMPSTSPPASGVSCGTEILGGRLFTVDAKLGS